jgi:hypothetical protein
MAPALRVEPAKGRDCTPPKRTVHDVSVLEGPNIGSKIERGGCEDAVLKITRQPRLFFEGTDASLVVAVEFWRPE